MKKLLLTTFILILIFPLISSAESIPSFPMSFWGGVAVNSNPSPIGTIIRAYYGSELAGQITIQESGIYGYNNPIKQKLVIREGVGEIKFTIQHNNFNSGLETGGNNLQNHPSFESASTVRKDLSFSIPANQNSTGSGGGGGGGGGGSTPITVNNDASNDDLQADSNKDGKVDILDFNALMVNWGTVAGSVADFNKDGVVDIFDFNLLMINWTK